MTAVAIAVGGVTLPRIAVADQYVYTPTNGASDSWSTGAGWVDATTAMPAVPVSSASTQLTFVNPIAATVPSGLVDTNTDDIAGQFTFGELDLQGTGPDTGPATINIRYSGPATGLTMAPNGYIGLNADSGAAGLTYNVYTPITLTSGNGNTSVFGGNGTANFNFYGVISGNDNVNKQGSSTVTFFGTNTFGDGGGEIQLLGGVVRLGSSTASFCGPGAVLKFVGGSFDLNGGSQTIDTIDYNAGNGPGAIYNGAVGTSSTFTVTNNGYAPVATVIEDNLGTGGIVNFAKGTGGNTVTLAATELYTGTTTVAGGTLQIGNGTAGSLSSATAVTVTGGTLAFNEAAGSTITNAIADNGTVNGAEAAGILNTLSGVISGNGGFTQAGAGITVLAAANTYTGSTTINAGTLQLGNSMAMGSGSATVNTGGTLDLAGQSISNNLSIYGTLVNTAGTTSIISANVNNGIGTTFTVAGTGNITVNGQIGNNPANTIDMNGTGTLTLAGGNGTDNFGLALVANSGTTVLAKASSSGIHSIGGGITVNGGLVQLGGSGGDQIYDSDAVTVNSGAFDLNGQNETVGPLNLTGTGINGAGALVQSAATSSNVAPSTTNLNSNPSIGVTQAGGVLNLYGTVSGGSGFTKVGAGTLVLQNSGNNYGGVTTITNGTVQFDDSNNQGDLGSSSVALNGGTLRHYADGNYLSSTHTVNVLAAGGTIDAVGSEGSAVANQYDFGNTNTFTGSGPISVIDGYLRFSAAQSFSGAITLQPGSGFEYFSPNASAGSFVVNGDGTGSQATNGELVDTSGATFDNAVTVNGGILSYDGGGNGNFMGPITLTGVGATVGLRNFYGTNGVNNGAISGNISGTGGLAVNSGTGTGGVLTLSGINTYSGATSITNAVVVAASGRTQSGSALTSSATGTGTVTINSGGVLEGSGGTNDVVVASGGTITAGSGTAAGNGSSTGTLTTGAQTWNGGGSYVAKANGNSSNDLLQMSGLSIAGSSDTPFIIQLVGIGSSATTIGASPLVIAVDDSTADQGTIQAAINSMALKLTTTNVNSYNGEALQLTEIDLPSDGGEELAVEAAPEPTSFLLLGFATTPLIARRRRRFGQSI